MMEKHGGLPQPTSSKWLLEGDYGNEDRKLETPTGKTFDVITVSGENKNDYYVIEISDWVSIAGEALKAKGKRKVSDSTKVKLIDFLTWFATKGLYSEAYVVLTGRGLATVCGVDEKAVRNWGKEVPELGADLRMGKMAELLSAQGFEGADFFSKIKFEGQEANAYSDAVCMAFLEYYAFEAGARCTEEAKNNYRVLARKTLRNFIYVTVGYDPQNVVPDSWKHFHDRLVLNSVPLGYFS